MQTIKLLIALVVCGWAMWWILSPPSRAVGRARALIVTVVFLLVSCAMGAK